MRDPVQGKRATGMSSGLMRWLVLLLVFSVASCTNMHPVELDRSGTQQVSLPDEISVGDVLRIRDTSGQVTTLKLVEVDGGVLRGTLQQNKPAPVEVPLATIESVEVRRADARANTTWVWGIILFLMASAAATPG